MAKFIHLRVISSYSLCYGALTIEEVVSLAVRYRIPAIALTERGNLFGLLEFSLAASKSGIQPIPSASIKVRLEENIYDNVLLFAKNKQGYQNLLKIVSLSFLENTEQGINATTLANLDKYSEGLIAAIGFREGELYNLATNNQNDRLEKLTKQYQGIFKNELFVEISRLGYEHEKFVENKLLNIAKKFDLPIVGTNDVKYATQDLCEAQDILTCIATNQYIDDASRPKTLAEHYFKSPHAMEQIFHDLPEAIDNTRLIAKKCSFFPGVEEPSLPNFETSGCTEEEEITSVATNGLKERIKQHKIPEDKHKTYFERLDYELRIIKRMGFPGYFLIVSDFIKWSKDNNIPVGPGRGSGAGSIVAWAMKITDLDPLKFGLLFERFLNPERVSMPDFDIDFCQERREEVINYVRDKYGKERVAQIITFGKLQAKAVLKDVGRVMQLPYHQVDRISKMIPFNPINPVTLAEAIKMDPMLQNERRSDPQIAKLLNIGLKLEGLHRHASTHAAGIVIANQSLLDLIPLYQDPKANMPVVEYPMKYTELAGLVKFDFLGLKTLTVIAKAEELIRSQNMEIDINTIPLDDKKSFKLLSSGNTIGVFQLESAGMRDCLKKMLPDKLEDLIALISLYRPGPMDNIPKYIATKHGREEPEYPHPILEDCLKETFGVIIYQEQVMQIAQILAGYSLGDADLLRRAMGKKIKAEMDAQRGIFVKGAIANNVEKNKASEIFDLVAKFAGYGFNKSHAAAYALIGYQTAYLKANFPIELITATLNLDYHETDKVNLFIQEAKNLKIKVLAPDINKSASLFAVEYDGDQKAIRYGLCALKAVGKASIDELVKVRGSEDFKDIFDLIHRCGSKIIQKRQLESLIKSGSLDSLESNRAKLLSAVEYLTKYAHSYELEKLSNQQSLFGGESDCPTNINIALPDKPIFDVRERLQREFEAFGFYLTEHPLDRFIDILEQENISSSEQINAATSGMKEITIAGVIISYKQRSGKKGRFATLNISDHLGIIDVSIFDEDLISSARELLFSGSTIVIRATLKCDDSGTRILTNNIYSLEKFLENKSKPLTITLNSLQEFRKINQEITLNQGDYPVRLHLKYRWNNNIFKINTQKTIKINPDILEKLPKNP